MLLVVVVIIFIVVVFMVNIYGMWGGMMLGVVGFLSWLEEDRLLLLLKEDVCCWVLVVGSWVYCWVLYI